MSLLILRGPAFEADKAATLAVYDVGSDFAWTAWVVASVGYALWMPLTFWLYAFRKDRYEWTSAVLIAVATILSIVLVDLLKAVLMLERPPALGLGIVYRPEVFGEPTNFAFPSGHASRAFTLAAVAGGRYAKWRVPFVTLAILTGISMIIIGRHFFSDVIAGAFLGTMIGTWAVNLAKSRSE
jgi:undecaprenyl-diphosphatase